jgi:thermostable 8-oxoguanine DNA glycosylase
VSQQGAVFLGPTVVQFELPEPSVELWPGLRWGALDAFPTPAYWTYQVLARRVSGGSLRHRLGSTLAEEIAACLLGGYGVPSEVGLAAFEHLRARGLLGHTPTADEVRAVLLQPLVIDGRTVHYRFASRKAAFVATALRALADTTPPQDRGRSLRDWLLQLDGVGYKTASWVARNWLDADDVAILDIHLIRAGVLGGFLDAALSVSRDYLALEDQFLRFSDALGVRASELDAIIWHEMMSSPRTVRRLLNNDIPSRPGSTKRVRGRPAHKGSADAMQARLIE